jgi:hypothetical protein
VRRYSWLLGTFLAPRRSREIPPLRQVTPAGTVVAVGAAFHINFIDGQSRPAGQIVFTGEGFAVYQVNLVKRQLPELTGAPCWIKNS